VIDLTDFKKRIDWADEDADALGAAAREFFELDPYDARFEVENDAGQMIMFRSVVIRPGIRGGSIPWK
jgi:hypothetical protein